MRKDTSGSENITSVAALLAAAFFWGTTFVAQNLGAGNVGTFTFLALRSILGTVIVSGIIAIRKTILSKEKESEETKKQSFSSVLVAGICCGICLFLGSALQQYGIELYVQDNDTAGTAKASFITSMYVVMVPVLSVFFKKKPGIKVWIAALICVAGLYLLCLSGGMRFTRGDIFELLCALGFSLQIMVVGHFSERVSSLMLSAMEFAATAVIATVCMFIFEKPDMASVGAAMPAILYAAVFSNSIAYTCQIYGQKRVKPAVASLIMCLESVFGVLSGWLILHENLSLRQVGGCMLIFAALLLTSKET
ncbi:MAG: DMT family transporter [Lachnospiraceae bacterium]|nr:DMT family transporter [Lachnospiraceae bacterium]